MTTDVFDLPDELAGSAPHAGPTMAPASRGTPDRGPILLVEDEADDARLVAEALHEANASRELLRVADADEALALLNRRPPYEEAPTPALVLLDLNLPRTGGLDVLAALKGDPELRRIPVVVLTSSAARSDILAAYAAHANAYLRKPVGFDALVELLSVVDAFWFDCTVPCP